MANITVGWNTWLADKPFISLAAGATTEAVQTTPRAESVDALPLDQSNS
ncbi:MAG: hypothetical protein R6V26_13125 [Roseovarius sp.]